jgi:hypothetical protein
MAGNGNRAEHSANHVVGAFTHDPSGSRALCHNVLPVRFHGRSGILDRNCCHAWHISHQLGFSFDSFYPRRILHRLFSELAFLVRTLHADQFFEAPAFPRQGAVIHPPIFLLWIRFFSLSVFQAFAGLGNRQTEKPNLPRAQARPLLGMDSFDGSCGPLVAGGCIGDLCRVGDGCGAGDLRSDGDEDDVIVGENFADADNIVARDDDGDEDEGGGSHRT